MGPSKGGGGEIVFSKEMKGPQGNSNETELSGGGKKKIKKGGKPEEKGLYLSKTGRRKKSRALGGKEKLLANWFDELQNKEKSTFVYSPEKGKGGSPPIGNLKVTPGFQTMKGFQGTIDREERVLVAGWLGRGKGERRF